MNKPTVAHMSRFDMKRMLKNREVPDNTLIIGINDTETEESEIISLCDDYHNYSNLVTYIFKDDEESFSELQVLCAIMAMKFKSKVVKYVTE